MVIIASLLASMHGPSIALASAYDLAHAQRVVDSVVGWNANAVGLGEIRSMRLERYVAVSPVLEDSMKYRRDGPSPQWGAFARESTITFESGARFSVIVSIKLVGSRHLLTGVELTPVESSAAVPVAKWLYADPESVIPRCEAIVRALGAVHPSYDLVVKRVERSSLGSDALVDFAVSWRGFKSDHVLSVTLNRANGGIRRISMSAMLADPVPIVLPVGDEEARLGFARALTDAVGSAFAMVGTSKKMLLPGQKGLADASLNSVFPYYEWIFESIAPDGNRIATASWHRIVVDAKSGRGFNQFLKEDWDVPSPLVYPLAKFEFDSEAGVILLGQRSVALSDCELVGKGRTWLNMEGWYSQGDFLFPVAYNEATGEMEIRTPDQVRYYRLPPTP